jgi:uncharacterized membrane protein YeaQ/YmgE (transglycosylase-associated protein family)
MQFKIKELMFFFLTFLGGSYAGNWIIDFFNLNQTTGVLGYLMTAFVPALFIWIIWKKWIQKAAGTK